MASVRSHVLAHLTRMAMFLVFRQPRPVGEYRDAFIKRDAKKPLVLPESISIEEIRQPDGRWFRFGGGSVAKGGKVILYLHGGAFILRMPNFHSSYVAGLAAELGCDAFMPWYRLAPEHPFPAAVDDAMTAYQYLLDQYSHRDIVVVGDSAGGNLVMAMLHRIRAAVGDMPVAALAISPVADFAQVGSTWILNAWRDPMYRVQGFVDPAIHYLQGADRLQPQASPIYGDYMGFPPLMVVVGEREALRDDAVGIARKAVEAQVPVYLQIWQGMPHVFPLHTALPESQSVGRDISAFLRDAMAGARPEQSCLEWINRRPVLGKLWRKSRTLATLTVDESATTPVKEECF